MPRRIRIKFPATLNRLMPALRGQFTLSGVAAELRRVALSVWNVGSRTFTQGAGGTSNIASSGPSGYTAGGIYQVDPSGTALPSGLSLSDGGTLTDSGAAAGTATGVVFAYSEPGGMPELTLHGTGTNVPYMATVYPLEGVVPSGYTLGSDSDANLTGSVLSAWEDGSAKVMVLAGQTSVSGTKALRLKVRSPSGTNLTAAAVGGIVSSIQVNFGGGTQTLSNFNSPDFVWWSNPQVICARYRLPCGLGSMEAVIDIHAFAGGRAFVEVVIENGKLTPATAHPSNASTYPATQTYAGATVAVNGSTISTVNSSASPTGSHTAFRSWYCSTWVGGDPGIDVTHDTLSMQQHPLLFKIDQTNTADFTAYASDAYTPWSGVRQTLVQAGTGDAAAVGAFPKWEAQYLQSGDKRARNAVIQSGLALLTSNIHYRDQTTYAPIAYTAVVGRYINDSSGSGAFPRSGFPYADYTADYHWDYAHQPAAGLIAFLCRPSPCFIEIAQKAAVYNALGQKENVLGFNFRNRGRAWGFRNIAHATFLTPDSQTTLKSSLRSLMTLNVNFMRLWDATPEDKLNYMWDYEAGIVMADASGAGVGTQQSAWMYHYLIPELHKAHAAKLLTGTDQTNLGALADWAALQPVRWVNEQPGGGWRFVPYHTIVGTTTGSTIGQSADWGAMRAVINPTQPASVSGQWQSTGVDPTTFLTGWSADPTNNEATYPSYFVCALAAAVERDVAGASTAWNTVTSGITNWSSWRGKFATSPRWGAYPRNKA